MEKPGKKPDKKPALESTAENTAQITKESEANNKKPNVPANTNAGKVAAAGDDRSDKVHGKDQVKENNTPSAGIQAMIRRSQSKELRAPYKSRTRKQILGRGIGSKRGRTATRGTKGHRARSGFKALPFFEGGQMPLARRLPKVGFSNMPFKVEYEVISLKEIEARFQTGVEITPALLRKEKLLKGKKARAKLTNKHKLTALSKQFKISLKDVRVTQPARKLLAENGSELIEKPATPKLKKFPKRTRTDAKQ
ncbi:50S ribosomal protein L15 [Spirochaetota bacterium]|nr:50S ribosomal protein L15 [Spirochaetota bacterium]